jgi:membrane-bound lytic murein transglycosylase D
MLPAALALLGLGATALPGAGTPQPGSDKIDTSTVTKELVVAANAEGGSVKEEKKKEASKEGISSVYLKDNSINLHDGQLNPRAVAFVQDYLDDNRERLVKMKTWGISYFNLIDNVFQRYDIPKELKYLAVIESELQSNCRSKVGARGPWQFMPETARLMGLKVNSTQDDRTNLYKSTEAAAKYLKSLYAELSDWLLVIAAYNGGTSRVTSAIRKSNSRDFWQLQYFLPAESRNHVKKFIATHYIMEGKGGVTTGGGEPAKAGLSQETLETTDTLNISGKYNSQVIAKTLEMELAEFNKLNPGFDKTVASNGYDLRLPKEKIPVFNSNRDAILDQSVQMMLIDISGTGRESYPAEVKLPQPAKKSSTVRLKNK